MAILTAVCGEITGGIQAQGAFAVTLSLLSGHPELVEGSDSYPLLT
jgi:hypothetical protein